MAKKCSESSWERGSLRAKAGFVQKKRDECATGLPHAGQGKTVGGGHQFNK
jgi:hypothetical protein